MKVPPPTVVIGSEQEYRHIVGEIVALQHRRLTDGDQAVREALMKPPTIG